MNRKAKRIKIKFKKGKWFRLWLPPLSFRFIRKISGFGLKMAMRERRHTDTWNGVDLEELAVYLDLFFAELAQLEPFVLVDVKDESEEIYVRVETV